MNSPLNHPPSSTNVALQVLDAKDVDATAAVFASTLLENYKVLAWAAPKVVPLVQLMLLELTVLDILACPISSQVLRRCIMDAVRTAQVPILFEFLRARRFSSA